MFEMFDGIQSIFARAVNESRIFTYKMATIGRNSIQCSKAECWFNGATINIWYNSECSYYFHKSTHGGKYSFPLYITIGMLIYYSEGQFLLKISFRFVATIQIR